MKKFISFLLFEQAHSRGVFIFGAGKVAQLIFDLCKKNEITVHGFCVSDVRKNKSIYNNLPVQDVRDVAINHKNAIIIICVVERGEKKIEKMCRDLGFNTVVSAPPDILKCDIWSQKRYNSPIIEVTAKIGCAINCKFCPQDILINAYFKNDKKRKNQMSFTEFKHYLDVLPSSTLVDFSGFVEPFLNKESLDMMEYAIQTDHETTLFTTFRGLNVDEFDRLINLPFRFVCVHTADAEGFANIPVTEEYLQILKKALEAKKPDGSPFIDDANCQSEPHPAVLKLTEGKLKIYCEMSDRAGNLSPNAENLTHVHHVGKIRCSRAAAMNHFVLLPDGSLALCCNDFGLQYIVGNLNESSYEDILKGEIMHHVWDQLNMIENQNFICRRCYSAIEIEKSV